MALDYNAIGLRIREFRVKQNLTQEDVASKMKVSIAFLSRIERGTTHINLTRLSELCDILGVTEGEILNGMAPLRSNYLSKEFSRLLKVCPKSKLKLLYKITQVFVDDAQEARLKRNQRQEFQLGKIDYKKTIYKEEKPKKISKKIKK